MDLILQSLAMLGVGVIIFLAAVGAARLTLEGLLRWDWSARHLIVWMTRGGTRDGWRRGLYISGILRELSARNRWQWQSPHDVYKHLRLYSKACDDGHMCPKHHVLPLVMAETITWTEPHTCDTDATHG